MDYDNDGTKDIFFNNDGKISIINPVNNNTVFEFLDSNNELGYLKRKIFEIIPEFELKL